VLLAIKRALLCQICDIQFKFEEDRTKTAVAIESDRALGTRSDKLTLQVILYSVQCHELHWTDNNTTNKWSNAFGKMSTVQCRAFPRPSIIKYADGQTGVDDTCGVVKSRK